MYRKIEDFLGDWEQETAKTCQVIHALTDAALEQSVAPRHRSLGRLAWHLAQTIPEMMNKTGLSVSGVDPDAPVPGTLAEIKTAYDEASAALTREIKVKWEDSTLEVEDNLYGENWKRGVTLMILVMHQAHHRGQMTVLMRQADLKVPGIYGPALEEWSTYGMAAPPV